jgi:hypothetical protein
LPAACARAKTRSGPASTTPPNQSIRSCSDASMRGELVRQVNHWSHKLKESEKALNAEFGGANRTTEIRRLQAKIARNKKALEKRHARVALFDEGVKKREEAKAAGVKPEKKKKNKEFEKLRKKAAKMTEQIKQRRDGAEEEWAKRQAEKRRDAGEEEEEEEEEVAAPAEPATPPPSPERTLHVDKNGILQDSEDDNNGGNPSEPEDKEEDDGDAPMPLVSKTAIVVPVAADEYEDI